MKKRKLLTFKLSSVTVKPEFRGKVRVTLREKCMYSELFRFGFSPNAGKCGP